MIQIDELRNEERSEYEDLINISRNGMLYHSIKWKEVLQCFTNTDPLYIVAKEHGEIVGALPAFMKRNKKYGNVLNSLPFYGSQGGPIVSPYLDGNQRIEVKKALLHAFKRFAKENDCISSTLITTPFETDLSVLGETLKPDFTDSRIGQITIFKEKIADVENEILYRTIEKRCRTSIRKAQKDGVKVEFAQDLKNLDDFIEIYKKGMTTKGGITKPFRFFKMSTDILSQNESFRLLFARRDEEILGGLLLFYYKNMVEYYAPCFKLEYSKHQPLSLLVYEAMKDAIKNGYNLWNFGGGGERLPGVYMFKKSWGAKDFPYYYYVNYYKDLTCIKAASIKTILTEYEWFYVLPFDELSNRHERVVHGTK
jgi:hypothetical protein